MPEDLKLILDEYKENIKRIFAESYVKMILYGSYAHGDNHAGGPSEIPLVQCG